MPIALDPAETAPVSLRSDLAKPEDVRPVFLFRHLTRRQVRQVDAWLDAAAAAPDDAAVEVLLDKIILYALAGWRNMGTDYAPDKLDDVLTGAEKLELAITYPRIVTAFEMQKKRLSDSRPSSDTANSAPAAIPPASA